MRLRWVPINLKTLKKQTSHERAAFTLICLLEAANICSKYLDALPPFTELSGQYIVLFSSSFLLWWGEIVFPSE